MSHAPEGEFQRWALVASWRAVCHGSSNPNRLWGARGTVSVAYPCTTTRMFLQPDWREFDLPSVSPRKLFVQSV